jgi:hypothetical protein
VTRKRNPRFENEATERRRRIALALLDALTKTGSELQPDDVPHFRLVLMIDLAIPRKNQCFFKKKRDPGSQLPYAGDCGRYERQRFAKIRLSRLFDWLMREK